MRTPFLAPALILAWLLGGAAAPRPAYDVVIRGGTIYDGSGGAPYVGDVAISGDRIEAVLPRAAAEARFPSHEKLELGEHALIPGLVNAHTHAAMALMRETAPGKRSDAR